MLPIVYGIHTETRPSKCSDTFSVAQQALLPLACFIAWFMCQHRVLPFGLWLPWAFHSPLLVLECMLLGSRNSLICGKILVDSNSAIKIPCVPIQMGKLNLDMFLKNPVMSLKQQKEDCRPLTELLTFNGSKLTLDPCLSLFVQMYKLLKGTEVRSNQFCLFPGDTACVAC